MLSVLIKLLFLKTISLKVSGSRGIRTPNAKATDLQSAERPIAQYSQVRKEEDGSVDILFYDWRYFGVYLQTPMIPTDTHSRVIGITIPQSTFVVRTGFEPASINRGRARYQFRHLTI